MSLQHSFFPIYKRLHLLALCFFLCITVIFSSTSVYAAVDYEAEMESRKALPIQSNEIPGWPEGPAIGAESAILMEMNTHTILYAKNIDKKMFPASTTKIMTCLLATQHCNLNEMITFSHDAVYDVPSDGSNMGIDEGEVITLEQAMYGVLVGSANEAASAVGEHVAASLGKEASAESFAAIMNDKAEELGCKNTHFMNANGLFDENHYTSAYDLALIGCEFFSNEILCKMSSTTTYHIPPTDTQADVIWINSKNKLLEKREYEYPYLLGSKTGYVSESRQTLVSGAEKDGIKLVCVVFKEESPAQFEDTVKLFNYGFENFKKLMVDDYETKYSMDNLDLFDTSNDLFGDSSTLMTMNENSYLIVPSNIEFTDVSSKVTYSNEKDSNVIATIEYTYSGVCVGSCDLTFSDSEPETFDFSTMEPTTSANTPDILQESSQNIIFVNVNRVIIGILIVAGIVILVMVFISILSSYHFSPKGQSSKRRKERKKEGRIAKKNARRYRRQQKKLMKEKRKAYKRRNDSSRRRFR